MKYDINPDAWDNHEPPLRPATLKRLKDFDHALIKLADYPAYKRGEKNLTYHFVIDQNYNQALSLPVATVDEALADLASIAIDKPGARVVDNMI